MNIRQAHIKLEMPSTLIISTFWFWDPMSNIIVTYYFDYCLRHFKTQFQSFQPDGNLARLQMVRLQPIICVNILLGSIEILLTNGHLLETHSRTSGLPEEMGTRGLFSPNSLFFGRLFKPILIRRVTTPVLYTVGLKSLFLFYTQD